jgi:3-hydroxyisobutyrate dehydrogenase-like beta-hydroxyacid dehydrogenase
MARVAVLHPGEMGAGVGATLVETGHEVVWRSAGRSDATRRRALAAGLVGADDLDGCDVVLSVCPPGVAVAVAESVGRFDGVYVDANAVSPATAEAVAATVAASGAAYVDGGIIGPPPREPGTTRLYLSGERAGDVARLFLDSRLEPVVLDAGQFAASATKMTYAAWTKISAALLLAVHDAARRLDVDDVLEAEWAISQPELLDRLAAARRSATAKGWRWEAEMREIAATFAAVDRPGGFGDSAAEVFGTYERPPGA